MSVRVGYKGNSQLKRPGEIIEYSENDAQELIKCMASPLYFIQNYIKIVHVDRGLVPFEMWDFQKDLVNTIHNNRFSIARLARQSGKTTTTAGYILWSILFQSDYNIGILANKGHLARDILDRIKYSYECLPKFLQQGIIQWNRGNIELENKSKVSAHATSASGVRGQSFSMILLDEFAHVPHNIAKEFFRSTYPVISSGQNTKVVIISTPLGLNLFYKMWVEATEKRSDYVPFETSWDMVPGRDNAWKEEYIRNNDEISWQQEIECLFIGSTATLISGSKLRNLTFFNPIESYDNVDIYEEPIKDHLYICTVDCSEGVGQDYSTINVIDVTQTPYKQVAKYRDNSLPLLFFPNVIYSIGMKYNEAFVLVETNNIGQQVIDILHYDLEYDNIYKLETHNIKGQTISAGFKRSATIGIKTTKTVKKIGCANLKTLIENDKLIINDFDTIAELNTFVRIRDSYAAEEGNNDDLVMGLVLFSWLSAQSYFKDSTNIDIRKVLLDEQNALIYENLAPVGFINNGKNEEILMDGSDVWVENQSFYELSVF